MELSDATEETPATPGIDPKLKYYVVLFSIRLMASTTNCVRHNTKG
jgi:hypothetical protein